MLELRINKDLIQGTKSLFINRILQLVMHSHNNLENNVETGISQELPVLYILFLIYISRIFEQVKKELHEIVFFLFIGNLNFIVSGISVKKMAKVLKKSVNLIIE